MGMVAGVLVSVILVILTGSLIAVTINTAGELDKLRRSIRSLRKELDISKNRTFAIRDELRGIKSARVKQSSTRVPKNLSGDLDLYHQGRVATVKAVFRAK